VFSFDGLLMDEKLLFDLFAVPAALVVAL